MVGTLGTLPPHLLIRAPREILRPQVTILRRVPLGHQLRVICDGLFLGLFGHGELGSRALILQQRPAGPSGTHGPTRLHMAGGVADWVAHWVTPCGAWCDGS